MPLHHVRYHHEQNISAQPETVRGFTVKLSPHEDPSRVNMQVAFCAYEDQFSRKGGREAVENKPVYDIPVTQLPLEMAKLSGKLFGYKLPKNNRKQLRVCTNEYAWLFKYFL